MKFNSSGSYRGIIFGLGMSQQAVAVYVQAARVFLLAIYLILSTRLLGPEGYGYIAVSISLVSLCGQFVGLGSGIANVREAARDPSVFSSTWGLSLARYTMSGIVLSGLYIGVGINVASEGLSSTAIVLIAISELIFFPLSMVSAYAFMALGRIRVALFLQLLAPALKTLLLGICVLFSSGVTIENYAWLMLIGTGAAAVICFSSAWKTLPKAIWPRWCCILNIGEDIFYSLNSLTNQATVEVSKPFSMYLSSVVDAGVYGAALRVVSAASMPMNAIIQSQAHSLFGLGASLGTAHWKFLAKYGIGFFLYSFLCGLIFYLLSEKFGMLLGAGFESVGLVIAWLGLWLPLFGIRQLIGAIFTTSDHVRARVALDIIGLMFFAIIAFIFVPNIGILGVVFGLMASEFLWIFLGCISLVWYRKKALLD